MTDLLCVINIWTLYNNQTKGTIQKLNFSKSNKKSQIINDATFKHQVKQLISVWLENTIDSFRLGREC